jgi:hypothetical protein
VLVGGKLKMPQRIRIFGFALGVGIKLFLEHFGRLMSNQDDYPQRRADDRAAMGMVYTLTERVSSVIQQVSTVIERFDDYAEKQETVQKDIRIKLDNHEVMVIKALNSWQWFAMIVSVLSGCIAGLFVWGYTEYTTLRDSVLLHHNDAAQFIKRQEDINETVEEQIKMLLGGNHDGH